MDAKIVSTWIEAILAEHGWSQVDLATRSKLSAKTIGRLAAGTLGRSATMATLRRIAEASGKDIPPDAMPREVEPERSPGVKAAGSPFAPTIPMRSFGPIPARLSPVGRGEIRVDRPWQLDGDGSAFAFYPHDQSFAPHARTTDLLYARAGTPFAGDITLAIAKDGSVAMGYTVSLAETGLTLETPAGRIVVDLAGLSEIAIVVLVARGGRPGRVLWSKAPRTPPDAAAAPAGTGSPPPPMHPGAMEAALPETSIEAVA